jgi:hypothetical protein
MPPAVVGFEMPFMVRSKGLHLTMRDMGHGAMVDLPPMQWARFDQLPRGVNPLGDHQIEVREIVADPLAEAAAVEPERRYRKKREE